MYILVDTNVYLDFLLDRGEQSKIAKRFFINAYISQSNKTLNIFFKYFCTWLIFVKEIQSLLKGLIFLCWLYYGTSSLQVWAFSGQAGSWTIFRGLFPKAPRRPNSRNSANGFLKQNNGIWAVSLKQSFLLQGEWPCLQFCWQFHAGLIHIWEIFRAVVSLTWK